MAATEVAGSDPVSRESVMSGRFQARLPLVQPATEALRRGPRRSGLAVHMREPQSRQSHVDRAEDDGQVKPTWADRSGVEDRKPTIPPEKWHVRVPAHHGLRSLRTS